MPAATLVFVSKRLQPATLALLCLITAQLCGALTASCTPEPTDQLAWGAVRAKLTP